MYMKEPPSYQFTSQSLDDDDQIWFQKATLLRMQIQC